MRAKDQWSADACGISINHPVKYRLQAPGQNNSAPSPSGDGGASKDNPVLWVTGHTIYEAVATVREAIAQAEIKHKPLCVLSLDFQEEFDKISHQYLFTILKSCRPYESATASFQINGHVTGPIPIRCAVRKGCPMSMALYTLCLNSCSKCWRKSCQVFR